MRSTQQPPPPHPRSDLPRDGRPTTAGAAAVPAARPTAITPPTSVSTSTAAAAAAARSSATAAHPAVAVAAAAAPSHRAAAWAPAAAAVTPMRVGKKGGRAGKG